MSERSSQPAHTAGDSSGPPPHRYTAALAGRIEAKWQRTWEEAEVYRVANPGEPGFDASRPKFYILDMFPYPSGAGLHVGHPEGYTATDIVARFKRMRGFNVLHPMGWDAFGLPAEQYAVETNVHPATTTKKAIETFRRQLQRFGFSYDWSREFATIDPGYYKWTQWIWLRGFNSWFDPRVRAPGAASPGAARPITTLLEDLANERLLVGPSGELIDASNAAPLGALGAGARGGGAAAGVHREWVELTDDERRAVVDSQRLAYLGEQTVNWCPALGTVLANEEVIDGRSERGGHPVKRVALRQWMFRITAYAERLLDDLRLVDWPESTRTQQTEWIGRSEGAEVDFEVCGGPALRAGASRQEQGRRLNPAVVDGFQPLPILVPGFVGRDPYPIGQPVPRDLRDLPRRLPHLRLKSATYFVTWRAVPGVLLTEEQMEIVLRSLLHFDGDRCQVIGASVMPDHVHWMLRPLGDHELGEIITSVKRYSASEVNATASRQGSLWQDEAFDHIVRDVEWLTTFLAYMWRNPVEAGIAARPSAYRWTFVSPDARTIDGATVAFDDSEAGSESRPTGIIRVFTTRPDTLFGATYVVLAPEHPLVNDIVTGLQRRAVAEYLQRVGTRSDLERQEAKEKTGVFTGAFARNPATGEQVPVWVADYVLPGYGTGAIMAVPAHDERDFQFAKAFALPIRAVVKPADDKAWAKVNAGETAVSAEGVGINSSNKGVSLDGLPTAEAKARIIGWLEREGLGERKVTYKLRDWLFSRQRYWGEPFPIVYDDLDRPHPLDEAELPVELPPIEDFRPTVSDTPTPPLGRAKEWMRYERGGRIYRREINTMPNWAGSCWYYLRYCDPENASRFVSSEAERYWMGPSDSNPEGGVDLYMGGAEHAVLHLLYARFWHKMLYDLGEVSSAEPFRKLRHQGLILSFAYQRGNGSLVPTDQVEERGEGAFIERVTGEKVAQIVAKMSKSLKNVVNPDDVIAEFGADTFRLYEMAMGPIEASKPWNPRDIVGPFRFLQRLWRLVVDEETGALRVRADDAPDEGVERALHRAIKKVGHDIEALSFNTAVAAMIEFVNEATGPGVTRGQAARFARAVAPFAPHIAEEVWELLGHTGFVCMEPWPTYDDDALAEREVEIVVQVNGKVRGKVVVPADADEKAMEAAALGDARSAEWMQGKPARKVIAVKGRLVNIVV